MKVKANLLLVLTILSLGIFLEGAEVFPGIKEGGTVRLELGEDEVAIFGYGSLMLEEQLERLSDDSYKGPFIMARLKGFKRTWTAHYPNDYEYFEDDDGVVFRPKTIVFLNIERSEGSKVNGVVFVCLKSELWMYDKREIMYDKIKINDYLEGVKVVGGDAYTYMARPESCYPTEELEPWQSVIRSRYVEIIEKALDVLGEDFRAEYEEGTQKVPMRLVY
jgi:cation transport regulator ChaC